MPKQEENMIASLFKFCKIVAINIAILIAGIAICEIIFGNWFFENRLNQLNLIRDRVITHDIKNLYPADTGLAIYSRDKYGLRGNFESTQQINILTVGGSTTDQRFIDDSKTWQRVLQSRLADSNISINIANAGVDGQSSFGHLKNFDWWFPNIPDLQTDYIFFYIGINDFYSQARPRFDNLVYNHDSTLELLMDKSATFHLASTLWGAYLAHFKLEISQRKENFNEYTWQQDGLVNAYHALTNTHLKSYSMRLKKLAEKTRSLGAEPVFITQPARYYRLNENGLEGVSKKRAYNGQQINGVDYFYILQKINETTCQVSKEVQAVCIDVFNDLNSLLVDEDFYDFAHMTPEGTHKLGTYLAEKVLELRLF